MGSLGWPGYGGQSRAHGLWAEVALWGVNAEARFSGLRAVHEVSPRSGMGYRETMEGYSREPDASICIEGQLQAPFVD